MNALKYIRDRYGVEAHRFHRIRYGKENPVHGTITGGRHGRLIVRLDGRRKPVFLHPLWEVEYLPTQTKGDE